MADTFGRFKSICDSYGVPQQNISVFATEATRTALNKDELLSAIKKTSGFTVDILSPGMESMFGAMGARSGFTSVDGLFMDLGGGSVQMTYVNSATGAGYEILAADAARSMPFGAAKLTAALSSQDTAHAAKKELGVLMKETFEELLSKFPQLRKQAKSSEGISIYFCGGGFRGYGSMLMHTDGIQPYPIPAIGGYKVCGHRFAKWKEMLHVNHDEEGKIYGMSKRRREQFPAIATVVQAIVDTIPKMKDVTFCSGGNREGVLFMKLPPVVREFDPVAILPGQTVLNVELSNAILNKVLSGLPDRHPEIISHQIIGYICKNIWHDMGDPVSDSPDYFIYMQQE